MFVENRNQSIKEKKAMCMHTMGQSKPYVWPGLQDPQAIPIPSNLSLSSFSCWESTISSSGFSKHTSETITKGETPIIDYPEQEEKYSP